MNKQIEILCIVLHMMILLRIFVWRENNSSGNIFGVIFGACDKDKFAMSNIIIGEGVLIIKPCLEGERADIRIFTAP